MGDGYFDIIFLYPNIFLSLNLCFLIFYIQRERIYWTSLGLVTFASSPHSPYATIPPFCLLINTPHLQPKLIPTTSLPHPFASITCPMHPYHTPLYFSHIRHIPTTPLRISPIPPASLPHPSVFLPYPYGSDILMTSVKTWSNF